MRGIPVVSGAAYGPAFLFNSSVNAHVRTFTDPNAALTAYDRAVDNVAGGYTFLAAATGPAAQLLDVAAVLTRDPALRAAVATGLDSGQSLPDSLRTAVQGFADKFTRAGGPVAARTVDLHDIERRLLASLAGDPSPAAALPEEPSILFADDLAPADLVGLDPDRVLALVTERGSPASHVAVIARELAIPCVVGVAGLMKVRDGTPVMVDGSRGGVEVEPDPAGATARVAAASDARQAPPSRWRGSGLEVPLLANLSDAGAARAAARGPADGVGLFRTELGFLHRKDEPTVAEQTALYAHVFEAFGPDRTVIVRTLDIGSDKPAGFTTPALGPNPALGVRGIRSAMRDPGLLNRQLEAINAAAESTSSSPWVMAPMVATVAEAKAFAAKVHEHGLTAGVMVEIPAAVLQAHRLLEVVDFLSVGTNDLAQYTMAADRNVAVLAHLLDPWQPAVLTLTAIAAEAGRLARKHVSVCGEAAADPLLAVVLVGMGVTSLSMALSALGPVGAQLAEVDRDICRRAAEAALAEVEPARARAAVREVLSGRLRA